MADEVPRQVPLLASQFELARRVGREPQDEKVVDALRQASDRFRGEVGHSVTLVDADVVYLNGGGSGVLRLPAAPVAGLSIALDGQELRERDDFTIDRKGGLVRLRRGRVFPDDFGNVRVTYTHGYPEDAVPGDIQTVVLEEAEIRLNVRAGIQNQTVLGDSTQFGAVAVGATQAWAKAVERYGRL